MKALIEHVPTNIITGFLGTGKTSTIQHLLSFKPKHERWAVLVNEFGTVGIDGSLYQNTHKESGGVFVREVPGGCMCCASGLPMQIALNVLLKLSNPHRLLIEPSGLGHPVEVVALLKSKYYKDVLDIQNIITLVDPQQYIQNKYYHHPTYQQQLEIADACIVNKTDMCNEHEMAEFKRQCSLSGMMPDGIFYVTHGQIDSTILDGKSGFKTDNEVTIREPDNTVSNEIPDLPTIPPHADYLISSRFDEGFHAISWRYRKSVVFDKNKLLTWLQSLKVERIKGILTTHVGTIGVNCLQGHTQIDDFKDCDESKLEIISSDIDSSWEKSLNECVYAQAGLGLTKQISAV